MVRLFRVTALVGSVLSLALPASASTAQRANAIRACDAARVLADDRMAMSTTAEEQPDSETANACTSWRQRIEVIKDAALVYDRCVSEPERSQAIDGMIDSVFALRHRIESLCAASAR